MKTSQEIKERLEYLRGEIVAERISMGEICELESLAEHIEPGDVLLLEWAGVPEFPEEVEEMDKLDDQKLTVRYKDRDPDPGECKVISINWETRKLCVSNGACRYNPYFNEVEIVPEEQEHKDRHIMLHRHLDELVADFITHTEKLPSKTTLFELMQWAHCQTKNPTENR